MNIAVVSDDSEEVTMTITLESGRGASILAPIYLQAARPGDFRMSADTDLTGTGTIEIDTLHVTTAGDPTNTSESPVSGNTKPVKPGGKFCLEVAQGRDGYYLNFSVSRELQDVADWRFIDSCPEESVMLTIDTHLMGRAEFAARMVGNKST